MKSPKTVKSVTRKITESVKNYKAKEAISVPKNKIKPTKIKNKTKVY